MSAAPKIPDALLPDVVTRHQKGWSLRRVADWLSEEKQLKTSRTAVSTALARAGVSEPEALDDVRAELVEEAPENLEKLNRLQMEREDVLLSVIDKSLAREDALIIMKLIAQQERVLLWKLRVAGLRAPLVKPIASGERGESVSQDPTPTAFERVVRTATPPPLVPLPRPEVSRNAPCPCGSGQKYKKCHGGPNPPAAVTHAVTNGAPLPAVT